jgi:glucose/arabinose dehydrogenase
VPHVSTADRHAPTRLAVAILVAVSLIAGACGSDEADDGAAEASATAAAALRKLVPLDRPTGVAWRTGTDDLYVTLQAEGVAVLRPAEDGTFEQEPELLIDRTDEELDVESYVEAGVVGLTFSPDGSRLYVVESFPTHSPDNDREVEWRLVEYTLDANEVVDGSERVLLSTIKDRPVHNAGQVRFGPDGYLYFGLGDGSPSADAQENGQNSFTLLGTVMRIDPTPAPDGAPYTVPADNPFADGVDGAPEVWIYGVRNPWRFSWDPETLDMWLPDLGDADVEEINLIRAGEEAGANMGWSEMEGSRPFDGGTAPPDAVAPIYEFDHAVGFCGVIGGGLVPADVLPDYAGWYLFSDFCALEIFAIDPGGDPIEREGVVQTEISVTGIETFYAGEGGPDDRVLVTTLDGLYQLEAAD